MPQAYIDALKCERYRFVQVLLSPSKPSAVLRKSLSVQQPASLIVYKVLQCLIPVQSNFLHGSMHSDLHVDIHLHTNPSSSVGINSMPRSIS